jgi:CO dehydrogenase/acetyl-CoA synthase epsilon subunit
LSIAVADPNLADEEHKNYRHAVTTLHVFLKSSDLDLVFGGNDYDLVVIYSGGMHYVSRMIGSDGKVLEYDGMKRYGRRGFVGFTFQPSDH